MKIIVSLLVCIACLVGCATPPLPKVDKAKNALEGVKTITILRPREPREYTVMNFYDPGFVHVSLNLEVSVSASKERQIALTELITQQNFSFADSLTHTVAQRFKQAGYEVTVQDGPWVEDDGRYILSYADIASDADAVLVIAPTIMGFVSPRDAAGYAPTVTTVMTLLGKDHQTPLYKGYLAAGWKPSEEGWQYAYSTKAFPSFEAVVADPGQAVASLKQACNAIANLAARQILY